MSLITTFSYTDKIYMDNDHIQNNYLWSTIVQNISAFHAAIASELLQVLCMLCSRLLYQFLSHTNLIFSWFFYLETSRTTMYCRGIYQAVIITLVWAHAQSCMCFVQLALPIIDVFTVATEPNYTSHALGVCLSLLQRSCIIFYWYLLVPDPLFCEPDQL